MAHDRDTLAEDWVTLWQSELSALAADRELRESWIALMALMASTASFVLKLAPARQAHDQTDRPDGRAANGDAGTAQPARTAPATATSEFGADEARRLNERISELESRLSAFEQRKRRKPTRPGFS